MDRLTGVNDGWSLLTLKEHLEALIEASEEQLRDLIIAEHQLRLARREDDLRAIDKAEEAMNKRLDSMNELRDQLNNQAHTFVSTDTYRADLDKFAALVERNRQDVENLRGLMLPREVYETALTQWSEWRTQVDHELSTGRGHQQGVSATWAQLGGLIAAAVGVLTIVVIVVNVLVTR